MSHEIYYTSAPEGIKRGSHGFCTVGVTDGIPKPLWERLEGLSGYRNHFEAGRGANPVLHAHWIITLAGKEYRVLSRICDSGADYTQRTNAFAHHIALEPAELPPAGPAWLIDQPNVMATAWDGRTGAITRPGPLPWTDEAPAICRAWQHAAGDPGWAGVLAEAFSKSHTRPVCILFNPGLDMLPLVAEAIRLLPSHLRWLVTFNTYFTSMPASATCLWRCCLAGTPAAAAGLRYAATGLVINLADPARLGTPANSPWVQMARTGIPITPAAPAPQTPPVKQPAMPPITPAYSFPTAPPSPPPASAPPQRVVPYYAPQPAPSAASPPLELVPPPAPAPLFSEEESRTAIDRQPTIVPARPPTRPTVHGGMFQVAPPSSTSATIAASEREQRRMKFALTAVLALLAVAAGTWLLVLAYQQFSPPPESPTPPVVRPTESTPAPIVNNVPPVTPQTTPAPPNPNPIIPPIVIINPPPTNPILPPPPPPPPRAPRVITLGTAIDMRTTASGLRDRIQTIAIPPDDFDDLKDIASLALRFPGDRTEYTFKNGEIAGTLSTLPDNRFGHAGLIVRWKDHLPPGGTSEVLAVDLDKSKTQFELSWRTNAVVRHPEIALLTYWLVQNSAFIVEDAARAHPQRIVMKPLELPAVSFVDPSSKLALPADLPTSVAATIHNAPPGWQADWFVDWDSKDPRQRTPANAKQVIRVKKPTAVNAIDAAFILTFRPGWATVESNFAERVQTDQTELAKAEAEITHNSADIKKLEEDAKPELDAMKQELAEKQALVGKSAAELARQNLTEHALQLQIDQVRGNMDQRNARLNDELAPVRAQLAANEQLARGYRASIANYAELNNFTVTLELPDGQPIAAMPFQRRPR